MTDKPISDPEQARYMKSSKNTEREDSDGHDSNSVNINNGDDIESMISYVKEISTDVFKNVDGIESDILKLHERLHGNISNLQEFRESIGDLLSGTGSDGENNTAADNNKTTDNDVKSNHRVHEYKHVAEQEDKQKAIDDLEDMIDDAVIEKKLHEERVSREQKARDEALKKEEEIKRKEEEAKKKLEEKKRLAEEKQESSGVIGDGKTKETRTKEERDELLAKLREKSQSSRQEMIQKRKKKEIGKEKSYPLTPIFYCDGPGCPIIMGQRAMCCPVCKCFMYCSKACQVNDWAKHKLMCGKDTTEEYQTKLKLYIEARDAADALYQKMKTGDYTTVIHEPGNVPASMFSCIAIKSNVLHWKEYIKNPLFTTAPTSAIGSMAYKLEAAMESYPDKKIYMISVLLDRLRDNQTTECVIRLFIADGYGETMNAGPGGKIMKQVVKYSRK